VNRHCPSRVRTLFVSDLHLGYKGADIAALNELLASCRFEQLYLVGDILDGWKLQKRWHWTAEYSELVDRLMDLRRRRVRIVLLTGNHDEKLREVVPLMLRPLILRRFGIRIEERTVHTARDGRRYLVMHGDQFDGVLLRGTSRLADRLWAWLSEKALIPPRRAKTGAEGRRWSLGKALAQNANALLARYHSRALRRVAHDGLDGIVFGHSHVPVLERRAGRMLANCGSWTSADRPDGHHTALVETTEGEFELLRWPVRRHAKGRAVSLARSEIVTRHADSLRIIRAIHALWRGPGKKVVSAGTPARHPGGDGPAVEAPFQA
jgi:UDP-2,3-diacylglucosamine pyrophosphatase LpxH